MSQSRDDNWIDLLMTAAKEIGLDVPNQARNPWAAATRPRRAETVVEVKTQNSRLVETSQVRSREDAAAFLEGLAGRLRDGTITLDAGAYSVNLDVADEVTVDLAASTQEAHGDSDAGLELQITLSWQSTESDSDSDSASESEWD